MVQDFTNAKKFYSQVNSFTCSSILDNNDLLLSQNGDIEVRYAPFDYIQKSARIVIVGITPGKYQADVALESIIKAKQNGEPLENALCIAKFKASFSGPMRSKLVNMLDYIGIPQLFNVVSSASLFEQHSTDLHFTSSLRYPVFYKGKNYSGSPSMLKTLQLRNMVETYLGEEASILPNAIWITLGPKPIDAVLHLVNLGLIDQDRVLTGMPHPSGANNERIAVFIGQKDANKASQKTDGKKLVNSANTLKQKVKKLRSIIR